jgi:hypothetical protein
VGQHLNWNIIPNNFTVATKRKLWCDRGMCMLLRRPNVSIRTRQTSPMSGRNPRMLPYNFTPFPTLYSYKFIVLHLIKAPPHCQGMKSTTFLWTSTGFIGHIPRLIGRALHHWQNLWKENFNGTSITPIDRNLISSKKKLLFPQEGSVRLLWSEPCGPQHPFNTLKHLATPP